MVGNFRNSVSEEALVVQAQNSDPAATDALVGAYTGDIIGAVKSLRVSSSDFDDYFQEGMIGFLNAVRTYNPRAGSAFATYASHCVKNRLRSALKSAGRRKNLIIKNRLPPEKADDLGYTSGTDPQEIYIKKEDGLMREHRISAVLSDFEKSVLKEYLAGCTYARISHNLGCDIKSVDNALTRAKRKLSSSAV